MGGWCDSNTIALAYENVVVTTDVLPSTISGRCWSSRCKVCRENVLRLVCVQNFERTRRGRETKLIYSWWSVLGGGEFTWRPFQTSGRCRSEMSVVNLIAMGKSQWIHLQNVCARTKTRDFASAYACLFSVDTQNKKKNSPNDTVYCVFDTRV